jgi:hypothetical protein
LTKGEAVACVYILSTKIFFNLSPHMGIVPGPHKFASPTKNSFNKFSKCIAFIIQT